MNPIIWPGSQYLAYCCALGPVAFGRRFDGEFGWSRDHQSPQVLLCTAKAYVYLHSFTRSTIQTSESLSMIPRLCRRTKDEVSKPLRFVQELIADWFAIRRATCFASGQRSRHLARWGVLEGHFGSWFQTRKFLPGATFEVVVCSSIIFQVAVGNF